MKEIKYCVFAKDFKDTSEVPKDRDLFYRCSSCGEVIPSTPKDNIGCSCGNVFIDKDCWRLMINDFTKFEVVKKTIDNSGMY